MLYNILKSMTKQAEQLQKSSYNVQSDFHTVHAACNMLQCLPPDNYDKNVKNRTCNYLEEFSSLVVF